MKTLRMLLIATLLPAMPALGATEDEEGWQALGHALTLVHKFVRIAVLSDDPQASLQGIDDVLAGRDPEANRALAGLLNEMTAEMPAEHRAKVVSIGRDLAEAARKNIGKSPADPASVDRALQARKDLNAMGLRYHDPKEFLEAVKRDDTLAVELFIAGRGVNLSARDASGRSALEIAKAQGNTRIAELLARNLPAAR
jgi:hypothetical protein